MRAHLTDGVWAIGHAGDVHLGALSGDIEHGWSGSFATLGSRTLPAVGRALNLGGEWADGEVALSAGADRCSMTFPDGTRVRLDALAAARLQILCAHVRAGRVIREVEPPPVVRVRSDRAVLRVLDLDDPGEPLLRGRVTACAGSAVELRVPTTRGPLAVGLPALAVLVAAAEATRDGADLRLQLGTGPNDTVATPAPAAQQAAAEAQWLLPGFERRFQFPGRPHGPFRG